MQLNLHEWHAWDPPTIARLLREVRAPWCVVGGWAIELFVGRPLRSHGDLEIAVPRARFDEIHHALRAYEFWIAGSGELEPMSDREAFARHHQTWVREPAVPAWRVDVMREPHEGDTWICRREQSIRVAYGEIIARRDGIPYLRPEWVLLFKAKASRAVDEADFDAALPLMTQEARERLRDGVVRAHGLTHPWVARLGRPRA